MNTLEGWRYWRCFKCRGPEFPDGYDFQTPRPGAPVVCPRCKAQGPAVIAHMIPTHFLFDDPNGSLQGHAGRLTIACQPALKERIDWHHHCTSDVRVVTCKRCQDTKAFQEIKGMTDAALEAIHQEALADADKSGCGCAEPASAAAVAEPALPTAAI